MGKLETLEGVKACSIDDCGHPAEKRTWCAMHYQRWQRWGTTDKRDLKMKSKLCPDCGTVKPRDEYYEINGSIGMVCKPCHIVRTELYRQGRLEVDLAKKKEYRLANIEYWRQFDRDRYWADPEKARQVKRDSYARNSHKFLDRNRRWRQANLERYRELQRLNANKRSALKRGAIALGFTADLLRSKVEYWGDKCWMCGSAWQEIDHVKPVSKGGSHILCNLRPICSTCNKHKRAKWPIFQGVGA